MTNFRIETDAEAYCFLKASLTPSYIVTALPQTDYFSQWLFHYRVSSGHRILHELRGDFRTIIPGSLAAQAVRIVRSLNAPSDVDQFTKVTEP
jgi:hypothetical protein